MQPKILTTTFSKPCCPISVPLSSSLLAMFCHHSLGITGYVSRVQVRRHPFHPPTLIFQLQVNDSLSSELIFLLLLRVFLTPTSALYKNIISITLWVSWNNTINYFICFLQSRTKHGAIQNRCSIIYCYFYCYVAFLLPISQILIFSWCQLSLRT